MRQSVVSRRFWEVDWARSAAVRVGWQTVESEIKIRLAGIEARAMGTSARVLMNGHGRNA